MKFPERFRFMQPGHPMSTQPGQPFGLFVLSGPQAKGRAMNIVACDGKETGWEHVSVSLPGWEGKCASWPEMCLVKDLFWDEEEWVVQFHPAKSQYVNIHPGVLHLWRKAGKIPFPVPPKECV